MDVEKKQRSDSESIDDNVTNTLVVVQSHVKQEIHFDCESGVADGNLSCHPVSSPDSPAPDISVVVKQENNEDYRNAVYVQRRNRAHPRKRLISEDEEIPPTPKKRGRPPKLHAKVESSLPLSVSFPQRGRPRTKSPSMKKRGRPPKLLSRSLMRNKIVSECTPLTVRFPHGGNENEVHENCSSSNNSTFEQELESFEINVPNSSDTELGSKRQCRLSVRSPSELLADPSLGYFYRSPRNIYKRTIHDDYYRAKYGCRPCFVFIHDLIEFASARRLTRVEKGIESCKKCSLFRRPYNLEDDSLEDCITLTNTSNTLRGVNMLIAPKGRSVRLKVIHDGVVSVYVMNRVAYASFAKNVNTKSDGDKLPLDPYKTVSSRFSSQLNWKQCLPPQQALTPVQKNILLKSISQPGVARAATRTSKDKSKMQPITTQPAPSTSDAQQPGTSSSDETFDVTVGSTMVAKSAPSTSISNKEVVLQLNQLKCCVKCSQVFRDEKRHVCNKQLKVQLPTKSSTSQNVTSRPDPSLEAVIVYKLCPTCNIVFVEKEPHECVLANGGQRFAKKEKTTSVLTEPGLVDSPVVQTVLNSLKENKKKVILVNEDSRSDIQTKNTARKSVSSSVIASPTAPKVVTQTMCVNCLKLYRVDATHVCLSKPHSLNSDDQPSDNINFMGTTKNSSPMKISAGEDDFSNLPIVNSINMEKSASTSEKYLGAPLQDTVPSNGQDTSLCDDGQQPVNMEEKNFKCSKCLRVFTSRLEFAKHACFFHIKNVFKCSGCPKLFAQKRFLIKHQATLCPKALVTCVGCRVKLAPLAAKSHRCSQSPSGTTPTGQADDVTTNASNIMMRCRKCPSFCASWDQLKVHDATVHAQPSIT